MAASLPGFRLPWSLSWVSTAAISVSPAPTVSTPLDWDEVTAAADGDDPLVFRIEDVLARVEERGDLFAPVLELVQHLPRARS